MVKAEQLKIKKAMGKIEKLKAENSKVELKNKNCTFEIEKLKVERWKVKIIIIGKVNIEKIGKIKNWILNY